jgi:RHS repeat-associated protein
MVWYNTSWANTCVCHRANTQHDQPGAGRPGRQGGREPALARGGERWRWPEDSTFPTDYRFTGQRFDSYIKLYQMGARWYDSALGRWLSANTLVPEPGNLQAFNRYSFVVGNPLRYIDPSGHIPIPEWIDRFVKALNTANDALAYLQTHTRVSSGAKPVVEVSSARQTRAKTAGTIATTADTVATAFSAAGAAVELVLGVVGAAEPSPLEEVGGLGIYHGIVNRIENWTSFVGTAAACWSDIEAGNTQVSIDSVTIGQDSLVSTGALLIGNQPVVPLEGFADTFINVLLLGYDANRTGDQLPTYFEFHWEMGEPWYIMIYLNTAAEEPSEEE